jgi:hypothetical protein
VALLSAAGVAVGLTKGLPSGQQASQAATEQADTIGIAGGIAMLVVLGIAYFAGGYVAGRMARFDGARQGVAVWIIGCSSSCCWPVPVRRSAPSTTCSPSSTSRG